MDRKRGRTILGDVPSKSLGVTYAHEHTVSQPPRHYKLWEPDLILDSVPNGIREVLDFKEAGGSCIVDASAIDYGRNVPGMVEIAEKTGVHIVATSGFNKGAYFTPEIEAMSEEDIFHLISKEATQGMDEAGHKPGILKFGTSYNFMTPAEETAGPRRLQGSEGDGAPLNHTETGALALDSSLAEG